MPVFGERRIVRGSTVAVLLFGITALTTARARGSDLQPRLGTTVGYGAPLLDGDEGRVSAHLHGGTAIASLLFVGAEFSGTAEAYTGSWACGTASAESIPAVAVTCIQPTLAVHALLGIDGFVGPEWLPDLRFGFEMGAGPAVRWLIPTRGGHTVRDYSPSLMVRATALLGVVTLLGGRWHAGVELEGRTLEGERPVIALGLRLDAHVLD